MPPSLEYQVVAVGIIPILILFKIDLVVMFSPGFPTANFPRMRLLVSQSLPICVGLAKFGAAVPLAG